MVKKSWIRRLSVKRGEKRRLREVFNQVFQTLAQNLKDGLPVTANENQDEAAKLLDAIRTYGFDCSIEVFWPYRQRLCL